MTPGAQSGSTEHSSRSKISSITRPIRSESGTSTVGEHEANRRICSCIAGIIVGMVFSETISLVAGWPAPISLAAIAGLTPLLWRRHSRALPGLALVVFSMVVLNAFLAGVLSIVDERYQCRVIWLIPLLAGIFVLDWLEHRMPEKSVAAQKIA